MASLKELEKEVRLIKERNARVEAEIAGIKERNARVEADKAWETSWARKIAIVLLTYIVVVALFLGMGFPKPFENALVPTIAFLLSTLTLDALKGMWIKGRK